VRAVAYLDAIRSTDELDALACAWVSHKYVDEHMRAPKGSTLATWGEVRTADLLARERRVLDALRWRLEVHTEWLQLHDEWRAWTLLDERLQCCADERERADRACQHALRLLHEEPTEDVERRVARCKWMASSD
jgi:hypothetical protein